MFRKLLKEVQLSTGGALFLQPPCAAGGLLRHSQRKCNDRCPADGCISAPTVPLVGCCQCLHIRLGVGFCVACFDCVGMRGPLDRQRIQTTHVFFISHIE